MPADTGDSISPLVTLGHQVRAAARLGGQDPAALFAVGPRHLAARHGLAEGRPLTLRLRGERLRPLPREGAREARGE